MSPALADLESPIAEAVDAVALAAHVAEHASDDHHIGLLIYSVFEADRKLAALRTDFDRLLEGRPMAANDNAAAEAA